MDDLMRANQALFDGDRDALPGLLTDLPLTGQTLWLWACAAEDDDERHERLQRVVAASEPPYAQMAQAILDREQIFAEEIARQPAWQAFLSRYRWLLLGLVIVIAAGLLFWWLGRPLLFPSPAPADDLGASVPEQPAISEPVTPDMTPMPAGTAADYMPLGSLRLLNVQYPAQMPASAPALPDGREYLLLRYEFTCGQAQTYCQSPPQAALSLALADASLPAVTPEDWPGLAPAGPVGAGERAEGWAVFIVPDNQAPRRLLLTVGEDEAVLRLDIPR